MSSIFLVMHHYKYREDELDIPVNELEIDKAFPTAEDALAAIKELIPKDENEYTWEGKKESFKVEENVTVEGKDDKIMKARYRVPDWWIYNSLCGYSEITEHNPEDRCYWVKDVPLC